MILVFFCQKAAKKEEDRHTCLLNSVCLDILSWANSLLVRSIMRSNTNHVASGYIFYN